MDLASSKKRIYSLEMELAKSREEVKKLKVELEESNLSLSQIMDDSMTTSTPKETDSAEDKPDDIPSQDQDTQSIDFVKISSAAHSLMLHLHDNIYLDFRIWMPFTNCFTFVL